jgi:hypothetical protein
MKELKIKSDQLYRRGIRKVSIKTQSRPALKIGLANTHIRKKIIVKTHTGRKKNI